MRQPLQPAYIKRASRMVRVSQLCLLCLLAVGCRSSPLAIAKGVVMGAMSAYEASKKLQEFAGEKKPEDLQNTAGEIKILENLDRVSRDVVDFKSELMDKIARELPSKFSERSSHLFNSINRINQQYRIFLDYVQENDLEKKTKLEFAEKVTSTGLAELNTHVQTMYEKFLDNTVGDRSIVYVLANETNRNLLCTEFQSPYQLLIDLYNMITTSDSQALVVKFYGYDVQMKYNHTLKFVKERKLDKRAFEARVNAAYSKVKEALNHASRELSACDRSNQIPKVTYSKLERVFQAHVMDQREEVDNKSKSSCPRKCSDFNIKWKANFGMPRQCLSHCESEPEEKRCNGKFADCQSLADELTVCLADRRSDRYYDWMRTEVDTKYGLYVDGSCEANNNRTFKKDKGILGIKPDACGYCVCTCLFEDRHVDRYFSLAKVGSDYDDNKVITGVRIRLINHVHYIQIKQGVLGPNGTIVAGTNEWKHIKHKVEDLSNLFEKNSEVYTVRGCQKSVFLDDVQTESSGAPKAITGVKFSQIDTSLRLEVEVSPFHYATGKLNGRVYWKRSGENLLKNRKKLLLRRADVPLRKSNRDISKSGQYVEFQITDLTADLGQNTVPYIDLQKLETKPPVPLAGVGLYLKYGERSGGFLGLRLFQYNYAPHM